MNHPRDCLHPRALDRLHKGHPWIRRGDFRTAPMWGDKPGLIPWGEHWFLYSPLSEICLRRFGRPERLWPLASAGASAVPREPILEFSQFENHFYSFIRDEISRLWREKQALVDGDACFRWLFADSDGFPGLVADVFANDVVVQILSAPVEVFWPVFERAFREARAGCNLIVRRNVRVRTVEGLEKIEVVDAPAAERVERKIVMWNGLKWNMQPGGSQKTGAYFDQRENHKRLVTWARRIGATRAWDVFSFEGGFGLHLARAGVSVQAVDRSEDAIKVAAENAALNDIASQLYQPMAQDAFDFLKTTRARGETRELIVLDPPSFARSRTEKQGALKGYYELNLRAIECLSPGGILVTCACSHPVTPDDFAGVLALVSHRLRRPLNVLEVHGPSPDHAWRIPLGEAVYLQAWFVRVG